MDVIPLSLEESTEPKTHRKVNLQEDKYKVTDFNECNWSILELMISFPTVENLFHFTFSYCGQLSSTWVRERCLRRTLQE